MMAGACMRRLADVHSGDGRQGAGRCTHTGSCTDTAGRYEAAPQQRISEAARAYCTQHRSFVASHYGHVCTQGTRHTGQGGGGGGDTGGGGGGSRRGGRG